MKPRFRLPFDTSRSSALTTPLRLVLATTAAFWMGTAQPQTTTSKVSRQVTELRFRDFFSTPVGPAGLAFSDTLRRADGQVVRLVGHMVKCATPVPGRFLLSPCPLQIVGEAGSQGNDLPPGAVTVCQDPSQQDWIVPHIDGLVAVNGTLSVMSADEPRGRMPRLRLQLGPDAARGLTAAEIAGFLHRRRHLNA